VESAKQALSGPLLRDPRCLKAERSKGELSGALLQDGLQSSCGAILAGVSRTLPGEALHPRAARHGPARSALASLRELDNWRRIEMGGRAVL
jgi:hypothetical protein